MPSPIAHSATGYAIYKLFPSNEATSGKVKNYVYVLIVILTANVPDLDFIIQVFTGQRYHHGFTHSVAFVLLASVIIFISCCLFKRRLYRKVYFTVVLIMTSHLVLDYFTDGGAGIQLFWPFSEERFISPVSLFPAVHHSRGLFHISHFRFITFELGYSAVLFGGLWAWKRRSLTSKRSRIKNST
jgi:inner membrane protein